MKKEFIEQLIIIEKDLAERLHPEWPTDIIHAAAIIMEEAGELMKACLDRVYFDGKKKKIRDEAVSVAAMCERFLEHFPDDYKHPFIPRSQKNGG
jgi:hypothetical protein